jgi:hypothetical protein
MASRIQQNGGSTSSVMELEPVPCTPLRKLSAESVQRPPPSSRASKQSSNRDQDISALPPPSTASEALQSWNRPRGNIARVAACLWSFTVMGANDAAYGVSAGRICHFKDVD